MRWWLLGTCVALAFAAAPRSPTAADTATAPEATRFVPVAHREGGRVVLPLTFPDGTCAELVYPRRLALAELGIVPYSSGTLDGKSPGAGRGDTVARDFRIRYGDLEDEVTSWTLLGRYRGSDGRAVGFWDSGSGESNTNYLAFQFGDWAVLVYDFPPEFDGGAASMTDAERAAWAGSFSGRETAHGFLRLSGTGPLQLAAAGDHAGPQLAFGGTAGPLTLTPGRCRRTVDQARRIHGRYVSWSRRYASWCLSRSMRADARGARSFMRSLIGGLAVRDQGAPSG
jgi:hypothetical protein